ncbi:hypothetical protein D3C85_1553890 [compost metagenome]
MSTREGSTTINQARRIGLLPKWPMSAYSASTPVMASTTAPRAKKEVSRYSMKKRKAQSGLSAPSTSGLWTMLLRPSAARVRNQISMMGANSLPTVAVPCFWMANSRVSTSTESGTI